jgi:hypothetical protein
MRRREVLRFLGGAAAAWPFSSHAQQMKPVVGYLSALNDRERPDLAEAFRRGLSEAGYIEGRNVRIEHRSADGRYDRLPALSAELVRRKVDVIVARGLPAARAAKAATSIVPIVFTSGGDPVARGLVASLNRPGGNLTGVTFLGDTLLAKRLELLRELRPGAASIALLVNPTNHNTKSEKRIIAAASARLGVRFRVLTAATDHALEQAFVAHRSSGPMSCLSPATHSSRLTPNGSLNLLYESGCRRPMTFDCSSTLEGSPAMAPASPMCCASRVDIPGAFSRARGRAIYPCSDRLSLSWSSTSRPPRLSA